MPYTIDLIVELLQQSGLSSEVFDPKEIATDLNQRTVLNDSLEPILDDDRDPWAAFQATWDR